jgi:signal transduction histidine kinase
LGVLAALRTFVTSHGARFNVPIEVSGEDLSPRPPALVESALFRIAHEAVVNAARHASASRIRIALHGHGDQVLLTVDDDGRGFVASARTYGAAHWGVRSMHERAQAIGGALRIDSAPGRGTRVTVSAPRGGA